MFVLIVINSLEKMIKILTLYLTQVSIIKLLKKLFWFWLNFGPAIIDLTSVCSDKVFSDVHTNFFSYRK